MKIHLNNESKIIELWLSSKEKNDPIVRASLKPICQRYKEQKYLVAVFLSGEADLYSQTRDLLLYNQQRSAEKDILAQNALTM